MSTPFNTKAVAFYLPQFHPTPENDTWWGKGFTEWTNVTKARPLWDGHYQPHLPTDLGFYDLRLRSARYEQYKLAKEFGIDAFCYHYYWFSGTRLLWEPVEDMLADQSPESDMPYCFCWANENWSRRWNGADQELLIAQKYAEEDPLKFIQSLEPHFRDRRYLRVEGKLFFIVYMPQKIPDMAAWIQIWRGYAREVGLGELHICAALTHGNTAFKHFGFDSGVEFPPHNLHIAAVNPQVDFYAAHSGYVFEMADAAEYYLKAEYTEAPVFRSVFPSWDNAARTASRANVMLNGTPHNYEQWLSRTLSRAQTLDGARGLVFINAWNEWAEGCHLEPDREHQRGFLQATLRAKQGESVLADFVRTPPAVAPVAQPSLGEELRPVLASHASRLNKRARRAASAGFFGLKEIVKAIPGMRRFVRWVLRRH